MIILRYFLFLICISLVIAFVVKYLYLWLKWLFKKEKRLFEKLEKMIDAPKIEEPKTRRRKR